MKKLLSLSLSLIMVSFLLLPAVHAYDDDDQGEGCDATIMKVGEATLTYADLTVVLGNAATYTFVGAATGTMLASLGNHILGDMDLSYLNFFLTGSKYGAITSVGVSTMSIMSYLIFKNFAGPTAAGPVKILATIPWFVMGEVFSLPGIILAQHVCDYIKE